MKKDDLKETESKTVVIATYAMAAEALDIKTLTTLILATPRTDVTQAVGRILRVKHDRPLVVDIVDSHDMFKNQWNKRKNFYKKNKYHIHYTDSKLYSKQIRSTTKDNIWNNIYDPTQKETNKASLQKKTIDNSNPLKGRCLIKL